MRRRVGDALKRAQSALRGWMDAALAVVREHGEPAAVDPRDPAGAAPVGQLGLPVRGPAEG